MNKYLLFATVVVAVFVGVMGSPDGTCTYDGEYLPDNSNCQMFYVCSSSLAPMPSFCGTNLCFNQDTDQCDFPENVPCCSATQAPTTAGVPVTTAPPTAPTAAGE